MTRFFNLESYFECCQNTKIFNENTNNFIPSQGNNSLPLGYKNFYQTYKDQEFLLIPALLSQLPKKLQPRNHILPKQKLGFNIVDDNSEEIFIIREANSLVLRSLQSFYLYANVYRYWNYASQLEKSALSNKPMIIYDFDSFTPSQIIPLTFEKHPQSLFPIPIIDTRNLEEYQSLKLNIKYEKIYDEICLVIAEKVIRECNLNFNLIEDIANYLQKINILNYIKQDNILSELSLILNLNIQDQYYAYILNLYDLSQIVLKHFPLQELTQIINKYSNQYNFVLLGNYTKLSSISKYLQQHNLIIPNHSQEDFTRIWQQSKANNFPLYGQHLDNISFFVRRKNENLEISLPSQICYQGQQEVTVYGEYINLQNEPKNSFPLSQNQVSLPFNINGKPLINDDSNKEQIYQIENQYFQHFQQTPELEIKIRFRLKPGIAPKLEVIDQYNRILNSSLQDREEVVNLDNLGFIPFEGIITFREEKSQREMQRICQPNFYDQLNSFLANLNDISPRNLVNLAKKISDFQQENGNSFPVILVDTQNNRRLQYIINNYNRVNQNFPLLSSKFRKEYNISNRKNPNRNVVFNGYRDLLLFLGRSHFLTKDLTLDFLFDKSVLQDKNTINWDIHIQNLARVSCILPKQKQFFDLFYLHSKYRQKYFYQINEYIWGYARILLWYFDFNNSQQFLDYKKHFDDIIKYCLTIDPSENRDYLQNALIALVYLLTFRENNPSFVSSDSLEYQQGKQLCQRLQNFSIRSKKANIDIPLNEFFEKILDGKATAEDTERMLTID